MNLAKIVENGKIDAVSYNVQPTEKNLTTEEYTELITLQSDQIRTQAKGYQIVKTIQAIEAQEKTLSEQIVSLAEQKSNMQKSEEEVLQELNNLTEQYMKRWSEIVAGYGFTDPTKVMAASEPPFMLTATD